MLFVTRTGNADLPAFFFPKQLRPIIIVKYFAGALQFGKWQTNDKTKCHLDKEIIVNVANITEVI